MTALKAFLQLGPARALLFLWYRIKLQSKLLLLQSPIYRLRPATNPDALHTPWPIPSADTLKQVLGEQSASLLQDADRILEGEIQLYGADWHALNLRPGTQAHWTAFTSALPGGADIKVVWETGRFTWATTLARASLLSGNEDYAEYLWQRFEEFNLHNPPNQGPHWSSAQEVALRLISLLFSYSLIQDSPASTAKRRALLAAAIAAHAERIPISLSYARAQDNNHLLSEAAGLISAAIALPEHPLAKSWSRKGRAQFNSGLRRQIDSGGRYMQQSSNYQRLMLQLALWVQLLLTSQGDSLPEDILDKLASATQWQLDLCELSTGQLANLGPNDGAYILPLTVQPFADHRPVLQTAAASFQGGEAFEPGPWDEMRLWLANPRVAANPAKSAALRLEGDNSWAYLRAATFSNRPGHADQLHLDLWWQGLNIACDGGSYLYNAPHPWDNALSSTRAHNTISIAGRDQMQRAGRFLWLDWSQAQLLEEQRDDSGNLIAARVAHNGYRSMNLRHERLVRLTNTDEWEIVDQLIRSSGHSGELAATLYWHMPDLQWRLQDETLTLDSQFGPIQIQFSSSANAKASLLRAGDVLAGPAQPDPILGWRSPTYAKKEPALCLLLEAQGSAPLSFTTRWSFPRG